MGNFNKINLSFDVIIVGGGIGGVCAAIASARNGMKTVLIQNRPVLGGNASSEVRVHIGGVPEHGYHYDARETGILEELRLETAVKDPRNEYFWIDTVLLTFCKNESNLSVFLNTNIFDIKMDGSRIISVIGVQNGTEKIFEFSGNMFIDGTGDGTIGFLAGAEFRIGRESKSEFNEQNAPEIADNHTLGATIMFQARDMKRNIPYSPPNWALKLNKEMLKYRKGYGKSNNHQEYWHTDSSGSWWLEYGGIVDSIADNEEIREHLQSIVFGLWDWIKNKDPKQMKKSKNFEISWISQIPGKRESRRLMGDYLVKESDLISMRKFDDQIAVGGWSIDQHPPEGFYSKESGAKHTYMDQAYSLPFRSIYSKNVDNLLIASRCISVTHVAHASTRLIATLGCIGQAAGTAAAICVKENCIPRVIYSKFMPKLQQELLKQDQTLIGVKNEDPQDLARYARISSNSEHECTFGDPSKFIPLYFPMAQRFYVSGQNFSDLPIVRLYLKNEDNTTVSVSGGIRMDPDYLEFTANTDLTGFSAEIPPNHEGWVDLIIEDSDFRFDKPGCYWIYLNENEDASWGKSEEFHVNGFRIGCLYEEKTEWETIRINGSPFFDQQIGFFGFFCFQIEGIKSPFPANSINNGYPYPHYSSNCWISKPFASKQLKNPVDINKRVDCKTDIEVYIEFEEEKSFSEIWFTFDSELNNSYPHQAYDKERIKDWPIGGKAPKCIRDLDIYAIIKDKEVKIGEIKDNYQRRVKFILKTSHTSSKIILRPKSNWGFHCFNLYEIRIY